MGFSNFFSESFVGWVGIEPTTNALKGRCSTFELPSHVARGQRIELCQQLLESRSPALEHCPAFLFTWPFLWRERFCLKAGLLG